MRAWPLALAALVQAPAAGAVPWDVGAVSQAGQETYYYRTANASRLGFPLATGDVNGDARADVILTPMNADSGPNRERASAGEAIIVLSDGIIAGERDLAALDPAALPGDIVLIYGADPIDNLGTEVASADLDGDGFAEAIIGAQYGDGVNNQRANSGEVAIIWGGAEVGGQVIDLANPPAGAVTLVVGAEAGDRLGVWVSASDFDGDGIADAIFGADQGNGPPGQPRTHSGETYVLYGGAALRARTIVDLSAPGLPVTVIYGIDVEDHSGSTVRGVDIDRDGVGDVLIGAGLNRLSAASDPTGGLTAHGTAGGDGPANDCDPVGLNCNAGEAYIVYGSAGQRPASLDLVTPAASTAIIYGIDPGDTYGEELFGGDFNGDGWGDLAIGALTADGPNNDRSAAGELALILGDPSGLRGARIDLAQPPANVSRIFGARPSAIGGDTATLLDLDIDGKDDLVVASPNDRVNASPTDIRVGAGTVFIFFGSATALPAQLDLAAVPAALPHLVVYGASGGDQLAYSMSLGDVNGDGRIDPILNAMGADGRDDLLPVAGDAYVLDAVAVSQAAGRGGPTPPAPYAVSGAIRYFSGDRPVGAAAIGASGADVHLYATDAAGAYSATSLPQGTWTVTPRKLGETNFAISAFDAAIILQHVSNPVMQPFSPLQLLACDVTANGTCSALDATRILQYVAGNPVPFQAATACGSDWLFTPVAAAAPNQTTLGPALANGICRMARITYSPLSGSAVGQDLQAIVIGDVTGNWTPSSP
ncbi:MAG: hypothetical protein AB7V27_15270 [Candidatus Binatia bacterium]